jgi:hypothetical protein
MYSDPSQQGYADPGQEEVVVYEEYEEPVVVEDPGMSWDISGLI